MLNEIVTVLGVASIPSMVVAGIVSFQINKLQKHIDDKEKSRSERDFLVVKGTLAAISLGEAQANELLKTNKVNGDTTKALEYASGVKHELQDFYTRQGIENLK